MGCTELPSVAYSSGTAPPRLVVPPNACDCHMHVFDDAQPVLTGGMPIPPGASLAQYAGLQRRLGTTRFVNVTPSIYGTDNHVLVQSLRDAWPHGRGVAVVNDLATEQNLESLHAVGVRGTRFNLVQSGTTTVEMMDAVARCVAPLSWHLQVHARPAELLQMEGLLMRLPVEVVLDHMACIGENRQLQPEIEQCLRRLLGSGRAWLKLSAPYFSARDEASHERLSRSVEMLIREFSDRLLWGSDWPHGTEANKPDDAVMMDLLLGAASTLQVHRILVDNPAVVYDFGSEERCC